MILIDYLKNPSVGTNFKTKQKALNYVIVGDELYKKSANGVPLQWLNKRDTYMVMGEIHEGICGSHRSVPIIKWLIYKHGYYWTNITVDCFQYAKGL